MTVNQPPRGVRGVRHLSVVLAALSALGCANHQPLMGAKVAEAERAVQEAQQAGAAVNAPLEFKSAQDKLKAAQDAMRKGNHKQAIRSADEATVDAEYARARVANQRVNTMADAMEQSIRALRQEQERLAK